MGPMSATSFTVINMLEIFNYNFMIRAAIAGIITAVIAPLIGSFLVVKRYSLIADTLSHIALAGVAIGLLTHTQPLYTAVIFTVIVSIVIEFVRSKADLSADAVLAMFLPGGLALSLVLLSLAGGFNSNLFSYLFGSITTVRQEELLMMFALGVTVVGIVTIYYRQFLYASFDEESARVNGINVRAINTLLVILTAITVSLSMRIIGILLVGALMVIPVTTAMQIGKSFKASLLLSILFANVSVIAGLVISFYYNLPAGGSIVLFALCIFLLVAAKKRLLRL